VSSVEETALQDEAAWNEGEAAPTEGEAAQLEGEAVLREGDPLPEVAPGRLASIIESLLFAFVPSIGRFGPAHAQDGLTGLTTAHTLHAAAGGIVLVVWTAALAAVGVAVAGRRDVN